MKLRYLITFTALLAGAASAADTPSRTSPVDANAACMDRGVDSSSGNCVTKDEGSPRRTYPPKSSAPVNPSSAAPVAASPTVRKSATSK